MKYDVAIVGASSAGLFAAERLARGGRRVAVFDRADQIAPPRRTLIITPEIRRFLGDLPVVILATVGAIWRIGLDRVSAWILALPTAADAGGKTAYRLELWKRVYRMIQDFPITGIGLNTFPVVVRTLYPLLLREPDTLVPHAHNFFLQVH